jgi:sigma-B regulation protein RsbU (phosphoserine phosphatase)
MMSASPPDHLATLYRISQAFSSSLDLDEVLDRVLDEVIATTRAERGFLMLREPSGALGFRVARGMDQQGIDAPEFQVSRSVVERVAADGQPTLTSDAQTDSWLGGRTSVRILGLRAILCVPLQLKGNTIGVIYVDNRLQVGIFSPQDLELLTGIASSAAIAIENARLYAIAVDRGRLEREMQMAREVQNNLIPRQTPALPGWDFAAAWRPAREVSGDFYDFVPLDGGRLGIVIADVTDKGMPAALFMAHTRSVLRASITSRPTAADALTAANRLVAADSANGMFVTLCYAEIGSASGQVTWVNAGHNPPLLYHARQRGLTELGRHGLPLGIDGEARYGQGIETLEDGDVIVLYTDGLTEGPDSAGDEFGVERTRQAVRSLADATAGEILTGLLESHAAFLGTTAPSDDVTVVVLRRVASA